MKEIYMLVRDGVVQRIGGVTIGEKTGFAWPVADTHEDAKRLAEWLGTKDSRQAGKIKPAIIGSVQGETLAQQIRLALEDGCIGAICVQGWHDDGSPIWDMMPFDKH